MPERPWLHIVDVPGNQAPQDSADAKHDPDITANKSSGSCNRLGGKSFFCSPQGHCVSGDQRLVNHAILDADRLRLPTQGAFQAEPDANVGQQGETHL